jgi:acid phosphatase family membrane protein YuiD
VRAELQELAQNEVLVSALVAGAGGQLTKSISSVISGNGFNWKLIIKSGGMPSSHSAVVSAAATALAFERYSRVGFRVCS